jgi:hypothetical protein
MAVDLSACPLFQKPREGNERIIIDSMPVIARRCRVDGSIGFFRERWLEWTGLYLDQPFGLDERSTFTPMT